jgi:hypothetical protein
MIYDDRRLITTTKLYLRFTNPESKNLRTNTVKVIVYGFTRLHKRSRTFGFGTQRLSRAEGTCCVSRVASPSKDILPGKINRVTIKLTEQLP